MRRTYPLIGLLLLTACPPGPYSKAYQGSSDAERKLLIEARRDVYPDDVRKAPETFRSATLAWPGVVVSSEPDPTDPPFSTVVVEHHYWDWIEDYSIQKAKAFLSPRGEGKFICHVERRTLPNVELKNTMTITYVRPIGVKDQTLIAACIMRFFPRGWYATDVMDYGRDGQGLKMLRGPME